MQVPSTTSNTLSNGRCTKSALLQEAVCNVLYIGNRNPNKVLVDIKPEEAWSGKRPCISHMHMFGCIAYAKVRDEKRTKLDAKGIKCLFVEAPRPIGLLLEMREGDTHIQAQGQEMKREDSSPCLPYILLSQHQPTKSCFDFSNPSCLMEVSLQTSYLLSHSR